MKSILKRILICALFVIAYSNVAFAAQNWTWIHSNDYQSNFIDLESMEWLSGYNNSANSVIYWTKRTYSNEGALRVLREYEINHKYSPSELDHSIWKVKLNFKDKTADVITRVFYRKDGSVIYSDNEITRCYLYTPGKYSWERDFYYLLSYLLKNNDYEIYQDFKKRYLVVDYNEEDDGAKTYRCIDKLSIEENGSSIECVSADFTFKNGRCIKEFFIKELYDTYSKTRRVESASLRENQAWEFVDHYVGEVDHLIPGTVGMGILEDLQKFCRENHAFVHRYDNGFKRK